MDKFKVVILENEFYVDEFVANHITKTIKEVHNPVIGFAAGNTFKGSYENLISFNKNGDVTFHRVRAFNLDEYIENDKSTKISFSKMLNDNLFSKVNIKDKNVFLLNGAAEYPEDECIRYEELIKRNPIDLQILGVGINGHIGYNEPFTDFNSNTQVINLEPKSIENSLNYGFKKVEDVPTKGITMGIGTIMRAKQLLMVVKGKEKSDIVKAMIQGKISDAVPSSVIRKHNDVVVVLDKEAASKLGGLYRRKINS